MNMKVEIKACPEGLKRRYNTKVERYCYKCYTVKMAFNFSKFLRSFADSGICNECKGIEPKVVK